MIIKHPLNPLRYVRYPNAMSLKRQYRLEHVHGRCLPCLGSVSCYSLLGKWGIIYPLLVHNPGNYNHLVVGHSSSCRCCSVGVYRAVCLLSAGLVILVRKNKVLIIREKEGKEAGFKELVVVVADKR